MDIIPQKQCPCCKQIYPLTAEYFSRDNRKKSGFVSRCKSCWKLYQQEYNSKSETKAMKYEYNHRSDRLEYEQTRRNTPEYIEYEKLRRATPEYLEKRRIAEQQTRCSVAYQKYIEEYRQRPDVKAKGRMREHIRTQRPEVKEHLRRYRQTPNGKAASRARNHNRRIRGGVRLSSATMLQVYENNKGMCWWCGNPVGDNYHIDHRIALSRGGDNRIGNLVVSCPTCNLSKYNKMPWEWMGRLL